MRYYVTRVMTVGLLVATVATSASAENIAGSTTIRDVTQSVTVKGNQIVAAIGKDASAMNSNATLVAKDAAKVKQTANVKGNQIVASIGVKSFAVNSNGMVAGGVTR